MRTRLTPTERIEKYRTDAALIEAREARKLLRKSPQWKAVLRALDNIHEARSILDAIELSGEVGNMELESALRIAGAALTNVRAAQIDEPVA